MSASLIISFFVRFVVFVPVVQIFSQKSSKTTKLTSNDQIVSLQQSHYIDENCPIFTWLGNKNYKLFLTTIYTWNLKVLNLLLNSGIKCREIRFFEEY